ncbi:MAG: ABC transporter permease, partial [Oceanibaculum nanhaiense]|nr:ABC transporter permease [Oceanibaculum nanhaiense]
MTTLTEPAPAPAVQRNSFWRHFRYVLASNPVTAFAFALAAMFVL